MIPGDVARSPAGIVTRSLAAAVDAAVVVVVTLGLLAVVVACAFLVNPISFRWPADPGVDTVLVGLAVSVGYLTVGWAITGRTVGGALLGLRVVARGGGGLGWPRSAARAVLCVAVPLGLLWVAVSARRRSIQDLLVVSAVVYDGPNSTSIRSKLW